MENENLKILILAAGLGSRLGSISKLINKSLLPLNNKAMISHIINLFPQNSDIVIAVGYKKESLKEYCKIVFPNRNIKFVDIDKFEGDGSGSGYSALKCEKYLQSPFYLITCDTIIDSPMPKLEYNWLGGNPTLEPQNYSTFRTDNDDNVIEFKNKDKNGFNLAFIGLAGIFDYKIFWNELKKDLLNNDIVSAFKFPENYPTMKIKRLNWFDTGNLENFEKTKKHFNDKPISISKDINEITYNDNGIFIKYCSDFKLQKNRSIRYFKLKQLTPKNFLHVKYLISYDWEIGETLNKCNDLYIYMKFLKILSQNLLTIKKNSPHHIITFYKEKTLKRLNMFLEKYGNDYLYNSYTINSKKYPPFIEILDKIDYNIFLNNPFYELFHGDLHFNNIIYNKESEKFTYIDWRESFAGYTDAGDIYYDISKLYGDCIVPYNLTDNDIELKENFFNIQYNYQRKSILNDFIAEYKVWLINNKFDLNKIKLMYGLIFLNLSPLQTEIFGKLLWFKSIEILNDYFDI